MWLNIALMATILCQCYCTDIDCNNMFPEIPYGEFMCHHEDIESQSEEITSCDDVDTSNITWTVTNTKSGTLSVEFPLMHQSCGYKSYRLDLFINENVTNAEECDNNDAFPLLHSRRTVGTQNHVAENGKLSPCGKTAVVTFNYVFTGCYRLEVITEISNFIGPYNDSDPKFIETDYKKDLLIDKIPRITTQYITSLQQLQFSVGYITRINVTRMELSVRKCDSCAGICTSGARQHWWEMALSTSGQFMCKNKSRMSNKPSCLVKSNTLKCTIHNITTGYYCVLVEIFDDRCQQETVWNNNSYCLYNSKIIQVQTASPQSSETITPSPVQGAFHVILVAVVLAFVLIGGCVLFSCRRSKPRLDSDGSCLVKNVALHRSQRILLLYSRDCQPFMNMMTTFRQVLKEVTMLEVYDCFDPLATEELCLNKTDWLLTRISSPDVKVVLVESKCAVLHQTALMEHKKVIYKEPSWLDDLFFYGLRLLMEDLQTNAYGRVFVVRIHGFTEENDNFCHITPFTRYIVPQNTEKLLSSLYQESPLEHVLILNEDNDGCQQRLQDDIKKLQDFKQENSDYLKKLCQMVMEE